MKLIKKKAKVTKITKKTKDGGEHTDLIVMDLFTLNTTVKKPINDQQNAKIGLKATNFNSSSPPKGDIWNYHDQILDVINNNLHDGSEMTAEQIELEFQRQQHEKKHVFYHPVTKIKEGDGHDQSVLECPDEQSSHSQFSGQGVLSPGFKRNDSRPSCPSSGSDDEGGLPNIGTVGTDATAVALA